jgi:hypothetical protein
MAMPRSSFILKRASALWVDHRPGDRWQVNAMMNVSSHQLTRKGVSASIVVIGASLTKNVFTVHGVSQAGKPELVRANARRASLLELIAIAFPSWSFPRKRE